MEQIISQNNPEFTINKKKINKISIRRGNLLSLSAVSLGIS